MLVEGVFLFACRRVVKSCVLMFQELAPKEKHGSDQSDCS